jgi:hypothetical protein
MFLEGGQGMRTSFVSLAIAVCGLAYAQDPTATIEGQVRDASGGVIAGAQATVTRLATAVSHKQVTNATGSFTFSFLAAGEYELRVEAPDFAPWVRSPILLEIN